MSRKMRMNRGKLDMVRDHSGSSRISKVKGGGYFLMIR